MRLATHLRVQAWAAASGRAASTSASSSFPRSRKVLASRRRSVPGWLRLRRARSPCCSPTSRGRRDCSNVPATATRICSRSIIGCCEQAFAAHGGYEVDTAGDAFFVAFASAKEAVAAAADAQQALAAQDWPGGERIWVRMGLHTGEPRLLDGTYVGLDVHHAARVMAAGHGGQVLLSQSTFDLVGETRSGA